MNKAPLEKIKLQNFRSYRAVEFPLAQSTIIIGPNGAGKTNLIEAIWMLSTTRSWRSRTERDVVRWEEDFARIVGGEIELLIEINQKVKKSIKVRGVHRPLATALGELPAVLFAPESMALVGGPPALRRRFIDLLLSFTSYPYLHAILELQRVLKNRNELLDALRLGRPVLPDEFSFWDERLWDLNAEITGHRGDTIKTINQVLPATFQTFYGSRGALAFSYQPSLPLSAGREHAAALRSREERTGISLWGPQRDQLELTLDGRPLTDFASRGEQRSAIFSLKLAEANFLAEKSKKPPLLLLDDIFSEFDSHHIHTLLEVLPKFQTIITATDAMHLGTSGVRKFERIDLT